MPKIVGKSVRVVDHDGLTIDECAGNVASNEDTLSIAMVKVEKPTTEPWLTLHYDEWICVTKGLMELHSPDGTVLKVKAGDTAFVAEGEKFRPIFPEGGVEYVPICLPAFRPDRCIREEGGEVSGDSLCGTFDGDRHAPCSVRRKWLALCWSVIRHNPSGKPA